MLVSGGLQTSGERITLGIVLEDKICIIDTKLWYSLFV
ncbi:MAG: hypothetical protein BAJATHORv1_10433 [Candidatus Thorarchaeota archaeon]|nr:MAG: hypothetical protein BAJATHORv1_10433 [Candidatus Thorarchaeota archaeon]